MLDPVRCETQSHMTVEKFTRLDLEFAQRLRESIREVHSRCAMKSMQSFDNKLRINNIHVVYDVPVSISNEGVTTPVVNMSLAQGLGELMLKENLSIEELVRLVRDQTPIDPRPNKKIEPEVLNYLFQGYKHHELMVDMATHGYDPVFAYSEPMQRHRPPNHKSAKSGVQALAKFVRGGQDDGSLLVLPGSILTEWDKNPNIRIHISPYGVVPKKGTDKFHPLGR